MPSSTALENNNINPRPGGAIRMDTPDHRQTASWGRSADAQAYQARQTQQIREGRYRDAVTDDIRDVRSKFGNKYDDAIGQMLDYLDYADTFADLIYAASGRCV